MESYKCDSFSDVTVNFTESATAFDGYELHYKSDDGVSTDFTIVHIEGPGHVIKSVSLCYDLYVKIYSICYGKLTKADEYVLKANVITSDVIDIPFENKTLSKYWYVEFPKSKKQTFVKNVSNGVYMVNLYFTWTQFGFNLLTTKAQKIAKDPITKITGSASLRPSSKIHIEGVGANMVKIKGYIDTSGRLWITGGFDGFVSYKGDANHLINIYTVNEGSFPK